MHPHMEDLHIYTEELSVKVLNMSGNTYRLKFFGDLDSDEYDNIVAQFVAKTKGQGIRVIATNTPRMLVIDFLEAAGMQVQSTKILYSKVLTDTSSELFFTPVAAGSIPFSEFKVLFREVSEGDPEISDDIDAELEEMIEMAGDQYNIDNWKLAYREGTCVGLVCPQLYPDEPSIGSIFYLGLRPDFREKGWGSKLHADGLALLKQRNAEKYMGSTRLENQPMNNIFRKNGCEEVVRQLFYGY